MNALEHFDAVKARIEANEHLAGLVHDTALVDDDGVLVRDTYVVLFGGLPAELGDGRMSSIQRAESNAVYIYDVRSVAPTADLARATANAVAAQLIGARLQVDGRRLDPIALDAAGVVDTDNAIAPPLFFVDDSYRLVSRPA